MFKNKSKQSNEPNSLRHLKRFELFVLKNHTYFEDGSKFYWVEHAWATEEGIHVFKSRQEFEEHIERKLTSSKFIIKKPDANYSKLNSEANKYNGIVPDNVYWKAITG